MARKAKQYQTVAEALRSVERSSARRRKVREKQAAEIAARAFMAEYEVDAEAFLNAMVIGA